MVVEAESMAHKIIKNPHGYTVESVAVARALVERDAEIDGLKYAMRTAINLAENGCCDLAAKTLRTAHGDLMF